MILDLFDYHMSAKWIKSGTTSNELLSVKYEYYVILKLEKKYSFYFILFTVFENALNLLLVSSIRSEAKILLSLSLNIVLLSSL